MKKRVLKWMMISCFGILAVVGMTIYIGLLMSLPALDGKIQLDGLTTSVEVTRDQLRYRLITEKRIRRCPSSRFSSRSRTLFQMDLARRFTAGELSALIGKPG